MDTNGNLRVLLLKDLCGRLPYGVILNIVDEDSAVAYGTFVGMTISQNHSCLIYEDLVCIEGVLTPFRLEEVKPCLRPMSSMTEEEKTEYRNIAPGIEWDYGIHFPTTNKIDWLNAHHFDFRNLIERGLAIDCTGLNIY